MSAPTALIAVRSASPGVVAGAAYRERMSGRPGGVAGAAALLTVLAAASAVLGFARDVVITAVFGAGAELDAYLVAQGLMNLVLALAAGAMAKASWAVPPWPRRAPSSTSATSSPA